MPRRRWRAVWRVPVRTRIWFGVTILGGLLVVRGLVLPISGNAWLPEAPIVLAVGLVLLATVFRYRNQWRDKDGNPLK